MFSEEEKAFIKEKGSVTAALQRSVHPLTCKGTEDTHMPNMNRLEAARAIRGLNRQDAVSIPIIAMTANTFKEDVDAAMDAGMDQFADKPLDVEVLYQTII